MFTRPVGSELVVITSAAAEIVSVKFADVVKAGWLESLTVTVSASPLTAVDGVPLIVPVEAPSDSPAGSVPLAIDQVYGAVPPLAASVTE